MTEPMTTTAAAAFTGAISGVTMALLGVDYHSLIGGGLGAFYTISRGGEQMGAIKAIISMLLTMVIGAILGSALVSLIGNEKRIILIAICIVCGAGVQKIVAGGIEVVVTQFSKLGGKAP